MSAAAAVSVTFSVRGEFTSPLTDALISGTLHNKSAGNSTHGASVAGVSFVSTTVAFSTGDLSNDSSAPAIFTSPLPVVVRWFPPPAAMAFDTVPPGTVSAAVKASLLFSRSFKSTVSSSTLRSGINCSALRVSFADSASVVPFTFFNAGSFPGSFKSLNSKTPLPPGSTVKFNPRSTTSPSARITRALTFARRSFGSTTFGGAAGASSFSTGGGNFVVSSTRSTSSSTTSLTNCPGPFFSKSHKL